MVEGRIHFGIQRDGVRVRVKGPRGAREEGRRAREEAEESKDHGNTRNDSKGQTANTPPGAKAAVYASRMDP